jgi:hypothetical protein
MAVFRSQLLSLFLVLVGAVVAIQGMWAIDFVIWFPTHDIYIYVPLLAWSIHLGEGDAVNWGYWSISLGLILAVVGSFALGESRAEQTTATGRSPRAYGALSAGIFLGVLLSAGYIVLVWPQPLSSYTSTDALIQNAPGYIALIAVLFLAAIGLSGRRKGRA